MNYLLALTVSGVGCTAVHRGSDGEHGQGVLVFAAMSKCTGNMLQSIRYIPALAGLLSAPLLMIGGAMERLGKVYMFCSTLNNLFGNTLQGGIIAFVARETRAAAMEAAVSQCCQTETCSSTESTQTELACSAACTQTHTTACVAQGTQTTTSTCVAQGTQTTKPSFTTQASQTTTRPCVAHGTQTEDIPEICCACWQHDQRLAKLQFAVEFLDEAVVKNFDVNAELRSSNDLLIGQNDAVCGELEALEADFRNLKNENIAAAAKLQEVRTELARTQADKLDLQEKLARVGRESNSSSSSSEAAPENSESGSIVTEDGDVDDTDLPMASSSSAGVASNWQANFQSLGLAQQQQQFSTDGGYNRNTFDGLNVQGGVKFNVDG